MCWILAGCTVVKKPQKQRNFTGYNIYIVVATPTIPMTTISFTVFNQNTFKPPLRQAFAALLHDLSFDKVITETTITI